MVGVNLNWFGTENFNENSSGCKVKMVFTFETLFCCSKESWIQKLLFAAFYKLDALSWVLDNGESMGDDQKLRQALKGLKSFENMPFNFAALNLAREEFL